MTISFLISIMIFVATPLIMHVANEINCSENGSYRARNYLSDMNKYYQDFFNWFTLKEHDLRNLFEQEKHEGFEFGFDEWCLAIFENRFEIIYK